VTFLLTFPDIAAALTYQKALKEAGMACDIDPVPPSLGLGCGYALRCEAPDAFSLLEFQSTRGIKASRIIPL
jgi:hypothetical protein